jgi:PKD domain
MKFIITLFLFIVSFVDTQAKVFNVLFIGNSYVAYNDLPNTFKSICTSMGDSVVVDAHNPGGFSFAAHCTDATTISKIQQGNWDYVILQGQSQEPSFSPGQVQTQTLPFAKKLDSLVKTYNSCAEVIFYMTWGRKYGDASNCANYPPICTYAGMQQRLRESYVLMAVDNASTVCPAGVVWRQVRDTDSTIELYNPDLSHPSVAGTYLVACSFYASIFHKQFTNTTFISNGVSNADATIIQNATSQIILDSIETWQQYGGLPNANFIITNGLNPIFITNNSIRNASSNWAFGDGITSINNGINVSHSYANSGNYTIILTAQNGCGKADTASQNITINTNLSTANWQASAINIQVLETHIIFTNIGNATDILLYTMDGKLFTHQKIAKQQTSISIAKNNNANLLYQIIADKKVVSSGRL